MRGCAYGYYIVGPIHLDFSSRCTRFHELVPTANYKAIDSATETKREIANIGDYTRTK